MLGSAKNVRQTAKVVNSSNRVVECVKRATGLDCELTIRDAKNFTLSCEGDEREKLSAFVAGFGRTMTGEVVFDADCDFTCAYLTLNVAI